MTRDEFSLRDVIHHETPASYDATVTETYGVYHRLLLERYLERSPEAFHPVRALNLLVRPPRRRRHDLVFGFGGKPR